MIMQTVVGEFMKAASSPSPKGRARPSTCIRTRSSSP
jgi:hypothetical protein